MLYRIITMGILHLSLTVCTDGNPLLHALVWLIFRYFGELARSVLHTARDDDDEDFFSSSSTKSSLGGCLLWFLYPSS